MRKILAPLSSLIFSVFYAAPAFAQAGGGGQSLCPQGTQFNSLCNQNSSNFGPIIGSFITLGFVLAIVIALGYLVYGGIKWILSEGDKGKVEESRNHVIAAVIGLIVVFLSYFILNVVIGFFLNGATLSTLQLPTFGGGAATH